MRIDQYVFDLETDPGAAAGDGGAGTGGDAGAAVLDAPVDGAAAPADGAAGDGAGTDAAAALDTPAPWIPPDTPEAREWIDREFDARLNALLADQQGQQQHDQGQPFQQPDDTGNPFAEPLGDPLDDGFGERLDARFAALADFVANGLQQVAQQAQEPYLQQQQLAAASEGDARAKDILSDLAAREGDFNQDAAHQLWGFFAQPHVQRYGTDGRAGAHAAELGLRDSANFIRGIEKSAYDKGRESMKNEIDGLAGVRGEPGAGTSGAQGLPEANSLREVTARYAEQARALRTG